MIARLIGGTRGEAYQFVHVVNATLSERATLSDIAYALGRLPFESRKPYEVISALGGNAKLLWSATNKEPTLAVVDRVERKEVKRQEDTRQIRTRRRAKISPRIPQRAFNMRLSEAGLSAHVFNLLQKAGYDSVGQVLEQLALDEDRILQLPNFGPRALEETKERLQFVSRVAIPSTLQTEQEGETNVPIPPAVPSQTMTQPHSSTVIRPKSSFATPGPLANLPVDLVADWWYQQVRANAPEKGPRLIETNVVGVTYENRQSVVAQLTEGEQLWLLREPHNPYDRNAIRVERQNGQQIGYLSREFATSLAPEFDRYGKSVPALVIGIVGGYYAGSTLGVRISFIVPETAPQGFLSEDDFDDYYDL